MGERHRVGRPGGTGKARVAREALDPCPIVPAGLGEDFGNKAALTVAIFED